MKFEKIMTVLAVALTTIVSVGCMEKEAVAVEAPTTESSSSIVSTIETTTSTFGTTTTSETTSSDTTTTTSETTSSETSAATTELASSTTTNTAISEVSINCCDINCTCAGTTSLKETTTMTVDEVEPESTESTTTEKVEEIVDALITDVSEFLESIETETEEIRQKEFVVYKPSTHYVHRSICHWVDSTCYEIEDTSGIEARKCTECNPDIEIINPFIVVETEVERKEAASSMSADYLGNFRITGYYGDGQTASGKTPRTNHTIAMNTAQRKELGLSYGDVLYIEGDTIQGYYTIEDCGCKWGVIDVYCSSATECYQITSYADAYSNVIINEN